MFGSEIIPLADVLNEIEQLGWLIITVRIAVFLFPGFNFIVYSTDPPVLVYLHLTEVSEAQARAALQTLASA